MVAIISERLLNRILNPTLSINRHAFLIISDYQCMSFTEKNAAPIASENGFVSMKFSILFNASSK